MYLQIIQEGMRSRVDSRYRFWMFSAVEAFLRGLDASVQRFVAETGLLKVRMNMNICARHG